MLIIFLVSLCLVLHGLQAVPTSQPSSSPSKQPSGSPTTRPSVLPTRQPTSQPSSRPSRHPTSQPSSELTRQPSRQPSSRPSRVPTGQPSDAPTRQPTSTPSVQPSTQPSRALTTQPTSQPTIRPSRHPTSQPFSEPTRQPSRQPFSRPSRVPTGQPSDSPTKQPTSTPSAQPSNSPTSPSAQPSGLPSSQPTSQPSVLPSLQPTNQPSSHPSKQPSSWPSMQPTTQPSAFPTRQPSSQPTNPTTQPSLQPSMQPSVQPTLNPTTQPSTQPIESPSRQPTTTPSKTPTMQPTSHPTNQPSRQPSLQPTRVPTVQPNDAPTRQPTSSPSAQPSTQPSATPTTQPSMQPKSHPTNQPSRQPSLQPSLVPTGQPNDAPTRQPTSSPSAQPSTQPFATPTMQPSTQPTSQPTSTPSTQPSTQPSITPTTQPSTQPTSHPTNQPSEKPSLQPSRVPTVQPSDAPTKQPTSMPSLQPSTQPSTTPTMQPSTQPTSHPTNQPSRQPSFQPTRVPTAQPSDVPTGQPTDMPSAQPSTSPSAQPSVLPSSQPTSLPSTQPSAQPSSAPSLQPFGRPTSVPSVQPSDQPSSQPTSPTSIPTSQPSSQPSAEPSQQPNAVPTSNPSPTPPCPPGTYFNLTGHTDKGENGAYDTGFYQCIPCEPGYFADKPKMPKCLACPVGTYSAANSSVCLNCDFGTYAENNATAKCTTCGKGEINGIQGSFSRDDCMNPMINFIMGGLALLLATFAIVVYMWLGRLRRIAFQRKFRLIRKLTMVYGVVLTTADMITRAVALLKKMKGSVANQNTFFERFWKPFVLFPLLCLIVIPAVTLMYILQFSVRIVFNAMVLWRAYKRLEGLEFTTDFLNPFLREVGDFLNRKGVFRSLSEALDIVLSVLSSFSIDLNTVKVSCPGAQSPLYLLTDMIIVAVVIFVIESDVHVFWTMMITPAMGKIKGLAFSGRYFVRNPLSTCFYIAVATCITYIPSPSSLVQYVMGFVVIRKFFNWDGSAGGTWVVRDVNCDGATGFPIDSILAHASAVCFVIVLPAVVYLLSVVLIEVKKKENNDSAPYNAQQAPSVPPAHSSAPISIVTSSGYCLEYSAAINYYTVCSILACPGFSPLQEDKQQSVKQESEDSDSSKEDYGAEDYLEVEAANIRPPEQTATTDNFTTMGSTEAVVEEEEEEEKLSDVSVEDGLEYSTSDNAPPQSPQPELSSPTTISSIGAQQPFTPSERLPYNVTPLPPLRSFSDSPSNRDGLHHLHDEVLAASPHLHYSMGSKAMRAVFSIFALDWIILYFVYTLAWFVFRSQQAFLTGKYMIHTAHKKFPRDRRCPASTKVKVFEDAFTYDRDLVKLRKYATNAQLCRLPLCDGWVVTDTADTFVDRIQEDAEWKEVEKTMPSYFDFAMDVRKAMLKDTEDDESLAEGQGAAYVPSTYYYLCNVLCHWFITQIMFTAVGRKTWKRVCKTYFGMILLCMGIWPEWLVRDFKIIEKFEEFKRLNEAIYRQVGNGVFSKPLEDAFTKIDNDQGVSFGQFVSAVTMCRIALLQIEPSLTVWAVFASSVAASPLLVCEAMHKKLPPLIATDAFQRAYDLLKETYCRKPPIIQTAFLGWYIFINQSRIIQFMLAGFLNIVSIGIIFFPQRLKHLIPPLVILIVHYGLLQSIYVVYMFKKLLFPEVTEEILQMEAPRILALDDDDDVTPGDVKLMNDSPCVTTDSAASPANPTSPTPADIPALIRPFSTHRGNNSIQMQKQGTSRQPGSVGSRRNLHGSLHGSMLSMSEIDDSPQMRTSLWRRSTSASAKNSQMPEFRL